MNVNTEIWGSAYTVYDDMNIRTGTTAITDPDYTDYPPFVKSDLSSIGTDGNPDPTHFENDCIYIGYLNTPRLTHTGWNPFVELDLSVAYCACDNPDLFICNPIVLGVAPDEYTIDDNYNYNTPNQHKAISMERTGDKITPIIFKNNETYARHRPNKSIYPLTGTEYMPYYAAHSASSHKANSEMNLWNPDGGISDNAGTETSSQRSAINNNAWCSYWRDFGIRTIFGVIKVIYFDGTYGASNGLPQNVVQSPVSLHYYESQTTEWKTGHPILGAYLDIYHRSNTNGTYTSVKFNNRCFVADILVGLHMTEKWGDHANEYVWQPASCLRDSCNSFFPLFGPAALGARVDTSITGTVMIGTQLSSYPVSKDCEPLIGYMEHSMLHVGYRYSGSSMNPYKTFWLELEGTDDNLEMLRKSAAAYGLFFADDVYNLADNGRDSTRWTDDNMCLGVVNSRGYTDGTYTRGQNNPSANNFLWKTASESQYDPTIPPTDDPTIYSDTTDFNLLGGVASCNKMYAVQASSIMNLARALSTAISLRGADVPPLDYSLETFLTNNPLDCIISLKYYPTTAITSGTEEPIAFGSYSNASVTGIPFVGSFKKLDFHFSVSARNSLYPHFGDFRDYEPYTHAELIVPFCGTVPINPCDFIGHDINVYMIVDYITGSCTAYIAADGLVVTSIAGQIGIEVPLSGIQQATLDGQRVNAVLNRQSAELNATNAAVGGLTSAVGFAGSLAGDNIVGAIGSGAGVIGSINRFQQADISYQKADYDLKHMQVPYKTVSAGSPVASTVIESCCRLIIYRPVMDDHYNDAVYAQTVGFACLMNGTVSEFTGLTVGNINTDGLNLTESEKQMIQKAFANGVIL